MRKILTAAAAVFLCAGVMMGCKTASESRGGTKPGNGDQAERTVQKEEGAVAAVYPQMAPYPNEQEYIDKKTGEFDDEGFSKVFDAWWEQKRERRSLALGCRDELKPFFAASIRQFLTEETPGETEGNRIYSPVNVYMALTMLAEITDGNSRQQILSLLGADSMEALRTQAIKVWNANYSQDGAVTSLLANSLWLDENVHFKQETLDRLAKDYYASSYWGKMGSKQLDERLQNWLNQQTGNLLRDQASGVHMSDDTLMALASTVYFRAKWSEEFSEGNTKEDAFHGPLGDMTCEFMRQEQVNTYYWGEKFGAVAKGFQESGGMWLILPDEGVTPKEVLMGDEVMELILSEEEWKDQKRLKVNLVMPKFDAVSDISLTEGLNLLGVTDVFDGGKSDFTPLTGEMDGIFLSKANHAARVTVDEKGCIAAAYTVMAAAGAAMPPDETMDFVVDRPFIFIITGDSGLPLFAGIVNEP